MESKVAGTAGRDLPWQSVVTRHVGAVLTKSDRLSIEVDPDRYNVASSVRVKAVFGQYKARSGIIPVRCVHVANVTRVVGTRDLRCGNDAEDDVPALLDPERRLVSS